MIFEHNDLQLYYTIEGKGTPILMLHGRPTDHRSMKGAFEPVFAERDGWQRVYVDLPGMGKTRGGSSIANNSDVVDVLVAFADALFGEQPFAVAGFSYGGYLMRGILHLRSEKTVGALLLVPSMNAPAKRVVPESATYFGNDTALFDRFPKPLADQFKMVTVVHEAAVIDRTQEISAGLMLADHEFSQRLSRQYALPYDLTHSPQNYHRPMLILTGKQDIVTGFATANEWHTQFPRATFVALDRAGHGLHMEQPVLFNALVHDWLDRMEEDYR